LEITVTINNLEKLGKMRFGEMGAAAERFQITTRTGSLCHKC